MCAVKSGVIGAKGMAQGAERQQGVGSFFSTPLVVGGVVYIGSADGRMYALE